MSALLSNMPAGRILLHLACILRHGNVRWHWSGITREIQKALSDARRH